jgi:hypothetical protein
MPGERQVPDCCVVAAGACSFSAPDGGGVFPIHACHVPNEGWRGSFKIDAWGAAWELARLTVTGQTRELLVVGGGKGG